MIKRVLLAIDGSPASLNALQFACRVSKASSATLIGLFVEEERRYQYVTSSEAWIASTGVQPAAISPLPPKEMLEEVERTDQQVNEVQEKFNHACSGAHIKHEFHRIRGYTDEVINTAAQSVDFVVIGANGDDARAHFAPDGATTTSLLHSTSRPVLVTPQGSSNGQSLVLGYDGSPSSERALRTSAEYAALTGIADFHLITVWSDESAARETQKPALDYLKGYGFKVTSKVTNGKPYEVMLKYTKEVNASTLALGAFGSNVILEKILGSTTRHILKSANLPLLLIH